jgi:hypothetical protein
VDQDFETKKPGGILMSGSKYILPIALLYFLVSLCGIFHHELWLDESHHWLLSRDSETLSALFHNARYEGHPLLWNILLFGITRITANPFWMQLLHVMIATTAVVVFLRKSPFPMIFKLLFIFGYFMVFEYSVISRNYSLGVLFLFLACAQFRKRRHGFVLLCSFLAVACHTHLMFVVIASALFLIAVSEHFENRTMFAPMHVAGYVIFTLGLAIVAWQIIPPADTKFFTHIDIPFWDKFTKGFMALFKGLIVIPDFTTIHFWNSNLIVNLSKPLAATFGLLAYFVPLLLYRSRKTLFFVYVALLGTQIFFFVTQLGATRYDGLTYIILITGLWLDHYFDADQHKLSDFLASTKLNLLRTPIVYTVLLVHFFSGITAYAMDYKFPFTTAREASAILKQVHPKGNNTLCLFCDGTIVSPYLEKKLYFLCEGDYRSYCDWQSDCPANVPLDDVISMLTHYMKTHESAGYITGRPFPGNEPYEWRIINNTFKMRLVKKTGQSIVRRNTFYIYETARLPITTYAE